MSGISEPADRASSLNRLLRPWAGRAEARCPRADHGVPDQAPNSHPGRKNVLFKSASGKTPARTLGPVLKFNILHLIATSFAVVTVFPLLREARGRSLPPSRLFGAVPFALATALLLQAMAATEPRLWLAGLFVGISLGAVSGSFLQFQLDRMYARLRLPIGRDGLWAACILACFTLVAIGAPIADLPNPALEVVATALVAACAGYLTGRAVALWRRSLPAPHQTLRQIKP